MDMVVGTPCVNPLSFIQPEPTEGNSLHRIVGDNPASVLSEEYLESMRVLYSFPNTVKLSCPTENQRPDWTVPNYKICFYEIAFNIGLRLPLPPFIKHMLSSMYVCPSQLMPNAWRLLLAYIVLCEKNGITQFIPETFTRVYYPKSNIEEKGRIQLHTRPGLAKRTIILGLPGSVSTDWRERYFFVDKDSVLGPDDAIGFPLSWVPVVQESLGAGSGYQVEQNLELIYSLPQNRRTYKYLLSKQELVKTSIWASALSASGVPVERFMDRFENAEKAMKAFKAPSLFDEDEGDLLPRKRKVRSSRPSKSGAVENESWGTLGPLMNVPPRCKSGDNGHGLNNVQDGSSTSRKDTFRAIEEKLLSLEDGKTDTTSDGVSECFEVALTLARMKKHIESLTLELSQLKRSESAAQRELALARSDLDRAGAKAEELQNGMKDIVAKEKAGTTLNIFLRFKHSEVDDAYIDRQITRVKGILSIEEVNAIEAQHGIEPDKEETNSTASK